MKLIGQEHKLLVSLLHDQADSGMSEPTGLAQATTSSTVQHDHLGQGLQRSISDGAVLAGSLRERFIGTLPQSDSRQAKDVQASQSCAESSHSTAVSQPPAKEASQHQLVDSAVATGVNVNVELQPTTEPAASQEARLQETSSAGQKSHQLKRNMSALPMSRKQHASDLVSTGLVARRKDNMYSEQKAYWQKKEALCPNIKNCIQEVQQLRAQLSQESASLFSDNTL